MIKPLRANNIGCSLSYQHKYSHGNKVKVLEADGITFLPKELPTA